MNKGSAIVGTCALCRAVAPLCDSHLMPTAVFRLLRRLTGTNRHPIVFGPGYAYQTSRQMKAHLLCRDCEARFDQRGEKWVMANCHRGANSFKLRTAITSRPPDELWKDIRVYSLTNNPILGQSAADMLVYFALSVFWRAGVREWPYGRRTIHCELGPFLEKIRLYLLDRAPFPDRTSLIIRVSTPDRYYEYANAPEGRNENGFHFHSFGIPGFTFLMFVGSKLPDAWYRKSTAPAPERYVYMSDSSDMTALRLMAELRKDTKPLPLGGP